MDANLSIAHIKVIMATSLNDMAKLSAVEDVIAQLNTRLTSRERQEREQSAW